MRNAHTHVNTRVQTYIYNIIKIYLREYPLSSRVGLSQNHIIFNILFELRDFKRRVNFLDLKTKLNFLLRTRYALCVPILLLSTTNTYCHEIVHKKFDFHRLSLSLSLSLFPYLHNIFLYLYFGAPFFYKCHSDNGILKIFFFIYST